MKEPIPQAVIRMPDDNTGVVLSGEPMPFLVTGVGGAMLAIQRFDRDHLSGKRPGHHRAVDLGPSSRHIKSADPSGRRLNLGGIC